MARCGEGSPTPVRARRPGSARPERELDRQLDDARIAGRGDRAGRAEPETPRGAPSGGVLVGEPMTNDQRVSGDFKPLAPKDRLRLGPLQVLVEPLGHRTRPFQQHHALAKGRMVS